MINNQIYRDGKDCGQIGDRMSDNDEKLPYWLALGDKKNISSKL